MSDLERLVAYDRMYADLLRERDKVLADMDKLRAAGKNKGATYQQLLPLLAVALIYLMMVMFFSWLVGKLERRLRNSDH